MTDLPTCISVASPGAKCRICRDRARKLLNTLVHNAEHLNIDIQILVRSAIALYAVDRHMLYFVFIKILAISLHTDISHFANYILIIDLYQ
jgi:hypothetical protein